MEKNSIAYLKSKMIFNGAEEIKIECNKHKTCDGCMFMIWDKDTYTCMFRDTPDKWNLKYLERRLN